MSRLPTLAERLISPHATVQDVLDHLEQQFDQLCAEPNADPSNLRRPSDFFNGAADFEQYQQAVSWWAEQGNLPPVLKRPYLNELCHRYNDALLEGTTFNSRLLERAERVVSYLKNTTNETPAQRRKRQNREAQARYRVRNSASAQARAPVAAAQAQAVADAYRAYMDACAERKRAYDACTPAVEGAHAAWIALKQNPPS